MKCTFPGYEKSIYPEQLFRIKLDVPMLKTVLTPRERISKEIDALSGSKLGLVIAPAGYGKTTAVVSWLKQARKSAAWLSIDSSDNSLKVFWNYVIAALGTVLPEIRTRYSDYFNLTDEITVQNVIMTLVKELERSNEEVILVLDDFHLIYEKSIHESMALLINYLPNNAHIIIISRVAPAFNSVRLLTQGHISEIGTGTLKFNADEISKYFSENGISVGKDEIASVELKTEGWATGLYLIVDSARQNGGNLSLEAFGQQQSNKINLYMTNELMNFRSPEEKDFLLRTSILSSMNGELCDALTGKADGRSMLRKLFEQNVLIVQLESKGNWFRYNHLFSEFLRRQLCESGIEEALLQKKAGNWYEQNGLTFNAIGHYLKGRGFEEAASLIEKESLELVRIGEIKVLSMWLKEIPPLIIRENDMLCFTYAWALGFQGRVEEASLWIGAVESRIEAGRYDEKQKIQLEKEILAFRGIMELRRGDPESILEIIRYGQKRAFAQSMFFTYGISLNHFDASLLAGIMGFKGRLRTAAEGFKEVFNLFRQEVKKPLGYVPALMGEILFERGDYEQALEVTLKAIAEAEESSTPCCFTPAVVTLARIMKAKGDIAGAFEVIKNGQDRLNKLGSINMLSVLDAFTARLNIETKNQDAVKSWVGRNNLDILGASQISDMYKYLTFARALIYFNENDRCAVLLGKLLLIAQKEKNVYYSIEIYVLQALNNHALGQTRNSMDSLRQALIIGEKEGYERVFVEEGMTMTKLLRRFASWNLKAGVTDVQTVSPLYIRKLILNSRNYSAAVKTVLNEKSKGNARVPSLNAPLTRREKEVLALLDSELSNAEIAYSLDISVNTVKVNCSNMYRKLDVKNREQAVRCARELKLLC